MRIRTISFAVALAFLSAMVQAEQGYHADAYCASEKITQLSGQTGKLMKNIPPPELTRGVVLKPMDADHDIDAITFATMKRDGVPRNNLCDDAAFLRRTTLLLTGRLPEPAVTRAFLADATADKRSAYIDQLLAGDAFNTFWSFWLEEMFQASGALLRGGLIPYNDYFMDVVRTATPLDMMAQDLLTSTGLTDEVGPVNFFARAAEGARLRQDVWDNIAVHVGVKFLGVKLECISCHDGAYHLENINLFLAERKREELWGMAAFFSTLQRRPGTVINNLVYSVNVEEGPSRGYNAETESGDRPSRTGGLISPSYLFNGAEADARKGNLQSIADLVVTDRQFARNFANRLWGHLFGLAMVEPVDSFDPYRIDPAYELPDGWDYQVLDFTLLEHMTDKMIELGFDLRGYLRYITNSQTFQMSAHFDAAEWEHAYSPYYTRFLARRLTAEQIYDSIVVATGVVEPMNQRNRDGQVIQAEFAHELLDTTQPRNTRNSDTGGFMDSFGRGNRYDLPRSNEGGIAQALMMMNSNVINGRLNTNGGYLSNYLRQGLPIEDLVRNLYLDILCREPSNGELALMMETLDNYNGQTEKARTATWLLLNKLEFLYIY